MTVYVDSARHRYRRMLMSHMLADTEGELHAMADAIGINRRWYQSQASTPHYDICQSKRALAIERGAVVLTTNREVGDLLKRLRIAQKKTCI
jgi:hypothetical protein